VTKFASFSFLQTISEEDPSPLNTDLYLYADADDLDQCLYYLRTLSNILRWSSDNTWAALAENIISTDKSHRSLYQISKFTHASV